MNATMGDTMDDTMDETMDETMDDMDTHEVCPPSRTCALTHEYFRAYELSLKEHLTTEEKQELAELNSFLIQTYSPTFTDIPSKEQVLATLERDGFEITYNKGWLQICCPYCAERSYWDEDDMPERTFSNFSHKSTMSCTNYVCEERFSKSFPKLTSMINSLSL